MTAENLNPVVKSWLKGTDVAPPDPQRSAQPIMDRVAQTQQRGRWWPLPSFRRTQTLAQDISGADGHAPTVTSRTMPMFSATKFVVVGVIVALFAGVLLIALPIDQQGGTVPGAATGGDRPTSERVTGQFVSMGSGSQPNFRYGTTPDGNDYYRDEVYVGLAQMSDERLSGKVTITGNNDYIGSGDDLNGTTINWGTVSIENDAGAWLGTHKSVGRPDDEGPEAMFIELVGSGAYEGWSAILYHTLWEFTVYGAVFSGNLPPDREAHPLDPADS